MSQEPSAFVLLEGCKSAYTKNRGPWKITMKGQTSQNLADGFKIAKNQPVEVASWSHRGSTFLFSTSCGSRCNSIDIFRWKPWEKIRKMPLIYHWSHSEFTLTNLLRQALGASCRWASWYQVGLRCGFWVVEKKSHLWFSVHKKWSKAELI